MGCYQTKLGSTCWKRGKTNVLILGCNEGKCSIYCKVPSREYRQFVLKDGTTLRVFRKGFLKACENVGIKCHILERRAIENYFSERAIQAVKGEQYRAIEPYQRLKDTSPCWSKEENWRIAREMTKEEFEDTDLGKFLLDL